MADYPKRERFFSHKFVRLLQKSCAAMDIGRDAALLLCYIAHTEDASKYSGPVRFWNEQLMTTMGFKSPKQLMDARSKAVEFGWLQYERSGNRQVGRYFVTIPLEFEGLDDAVIEPNHSVNHSAGGTNSGMNKERIAERISDGSRNESVTESGKHSIPIPKPNPNPSVSQSGSTDGTTDLFSWEDIADRLAAMRATRWRENIDKAKANGCTPIIASQVIDYGVANGIEIGAILYRLSRSRPSMPIDAGWPEKPRTVRESDSAKAKKVSAREETARQSRASEIVKAGRKKYGPNDELIIAELKAEGLEWPR